MGSLIELSLGNPDKTQDEQNSDSLSGYKRRKSFQISISFRSKRKPSSKHQEWLYDEQHYRLISQWRQ
jgi:hypothetical protein